MKDFTRVPEDLISWIEKEKENGVAVVIQNLEVDNKTYSVGLKFKKCFFTILRANSQWVSSFQCQQSLEIREYSWNKDPRSISRSIGA